MFHTGNVAEFHEPWLRYLLYQYVKKLDHPLLTEEEVKNSLTDDKIFLKYVQHYKNIVTLYVATKMEIWMALFMKPVFGVTGGFYHMNLHHHAVLFIFIAICMQNMITNVKVI